VHCDKRVLEFDRTLNRRERISIPPDCGTVGLPGSAGPCAVRCEDLGLPALTGASKVSVLAELMPALELALASCTDLSDEESALISLFSKRLTVLEKTHEERKAAHLAAARAHLKAVLALAAVPEVAKVCLLPCSVLSPSLVMIPRLQLWAAS
jgi:hypothetical protein